MANQRTLKAWKTGESRGVPTALVVGYGLTLVFFLIANGVLAGLLETEVVRLMGTSGLISAAGDQDKSALLYGWSACAGGSKAARTYQSALRVRVVFPYLPSPDISKNDVIRRQSSADQVCWITPEEGVHTSVSALMTALRRSWPYQLRRWINGGIQFATFWVAFSGIALMLFRHWWPTFQDGRELPEALLSLGPDPGPRPGPGNLMPEDTDFVDYWKRVVTTRDNAHARGQWRPSAELIAAACDSYYREGAVGAARQELRAAADEVRAAIDSRYAWVRYAIWAVPALGFIGTVFGIGAALGDAHLIMGTTQDALDREGVIQSITASLGVAFDTTLVALVLSLVLMLMFFGFTRYEEYHLQYVSDQIADRVIARFRGLPLQNILKLVTLDFIKEREQRLQAARGRIDAAMHDELTRSSSGNGAGDSPEA